MATSAADFSAAIGKQKNVPTFSIGAKTGTNSINIPDSDFWINFDDENFQVDRRALALAITAAETASGLRTEAMTIALGLRSRIDTLRKELAKLGFPELSEGEMALFMIDVISTRTWGLCSPEMQAAMDQLFPTPPPKK
jgi:hypothetical protein